MSVASFKIFVPQTGSSPAPQPSPMAKPAQHTVTVSSAGIQGPVSIQLQSPGGQGRLVQGAQGQLATLVSTVKQQQASGQQGDNQQEAISAIVQSLMRAETQFEQKKLEDSQRKIPSSPSPSLVSPTPVPQLPTAPLPPSSLGPRSTAPRVSLAGLLASPPPPQTVTVTSPQLAVSGVSQLAAQLARPVATSSLPPSYSQALRDQQTSPRKRPEALTSPSPQQQQLSSEGGAAALSALLADTPAADKPLPPGQGVHNNNSNALLERLVSQSHAGAAGTSQGSNLTPAASQLPSVHPNSSNGGSSEEITLQSLLSNPGKAPAQSPSKHSPLLQQLQQPVGQVRMYQPGASPRQPPASPRSSVTSPRSLSSPRPTPPSPRPPSALQQQLMQPPAPRYPTPTTHSSILSAALSSNISSSRSSQQLLQNLVQVSQAGQVVSVSLAADNTTTPPVTSTIAAPNGHLMVQGVQGGFQLVPQVGSHGQQLQLVQQSGNGGGVQLVNSVPGQGGQLQLVSQGQLSLAGQVTSQPQFQVVHPGQQLQIVQNQPVAGQPVSFAVNGVSQTVGRAATTMAKLVSSPNGAGQTLVVQGAGGNILLPQQQQFSLKQGGQVMVRQQQVVAGPVGAPAQVMVRPSQQPVQIQQPFQVVQVPANQIANHNQIIQIGRSMAVNNLVSVKTPTVVGTPSPQGPPTPGLALSPALPSPSPQASTADPPLVVQMEGSHPHFLAQPQQIINNINNKPGPLNQTQFKIRQQRKQSLK